YITCAVSPGTASRRGSGHADKAFSLQMENNLLSCFLGRQFAGVNRHFGIGGSLIGIGNPGELFENALSCLGVKSLAVALLAHFHRSRDVHENESAIRLDH